MQKTLRNTKKKQRFEQQTAKDLSVMKSSNHPPLFRPYQAAGCVNEIIYSTFMSILLKGLDERVRT